MARSRCLKHFDSTKVLSWARAPEGRGNKSVAVTQISLLGKSDREATSSRKLSLSALESAPCSDFSVEAPLPFYLVLWQLGELFSLPLESSF